MSISHKCRKDQISAVGFSSDLDTLSPITYFHILTAIETIKKIEMKNCITWFISRLDNFMLNYTAPDFCVNKCLLQHMETLSHIVETPVVSYAT